MSAHTGSANSTCDDATRQQVEAFSQRQLANSRFAAISNSGIAFAAEMMVVALGVAKDRPKHVTGRVRGETRTAVIGTLSLVKLGRFCEPGDDKSQSTLLCFDGEKAEEVAMTKLFGVEVIFKKDATFTRFAPVSKAFRRVAARRMNWCLQTDFL